MRTRWTLTVGWQYELTEVSLLWLIKHKTRLFVETVDIIEFLLCYVSKCQLFENEFLMISTNKQLRLLLIPTILLHPFISNILQKSLIVPPG